MGPRRILLVEDEGALLALIKRHLERSGHTVVASMSAEAAEEELAAGAWAPELLITDQTLPGETGAMLAARLVGRFPLLYCLVCSGYPLSPDEIPGVDRSRLGILQKPYSPAGLDQAIAELGI